MKQGGREPLTNRDEMKNGSSTSPKSRSTTILFVTIFSLLLLFSYYLLVHVPTHEDKMHKQHIRVLNKISQNIKTKIGGTISNARNIAEYSLVNACESQFNKTDRAKLKGKKCIDNLDSLKSALIVNASDTQEATRKEGDFKQTLKDSLKTNTSYFNKNIRFEEFRFDPAPSDAISISVKEVEFGKPAIFISDSLTVNDKTQLYYHISISADNLISNLLRFDHFEKFALFSPQGALFESHPTGSSMNFDSLLSTKKSLNTIQFKEVDYGGIPHIAYFRPIHINNDNRWVLAGFISSEKVGNQKYSLSPLFSIILLLIITLTVLSIPFIKIKIMHVREHLTVKEVVFSFISATLITSILILLVALGYTYLSIDTPKVEEGLKNIAANISDSLSTEITNVVAILNDPMIEGAMMRPTGDVNLISLTGGQKPQVNSIENLFGIKSNGIQHEHKLSILDTPTPAINISTRDYFRKATNEELLCTEGFKVAEKCFYLESIISLNTGKQLAAVSIANSGNPDIIVKAAAGRFYSIIETLLPPGYGFVIINQNGSVLFHNDSNRNLQENLSMKLMTPIS